MKIERIFIAGHKGDLRWTQCCIASIRRWYPNIAISLIKDLYRGDYDTGELESFWDVEVWRTERQVFGWGMSKLEPLFAPTGERILVLDSDIVFVGRVLDRLEEYDSDFVVDGHQNHPDNVPLYFFDLPRLQAIDPEFLFPNYVFGGGHVVATAGLLQRADFEPFIDFTPPPRLRDETVFRAGEQGVLNYVVLKKVMQGQLTIARPAFAHWAGYLNPRRIRIRKLTSTSPYPCLVHYAGPKNTLFCANRNGHLLRYFEAAYYARLPQGRMRRQRDRLRRLMDVLAKRQPWTQYV